MSLELKIEALTAAVTALTAQLQAGNVAAPVPIAPALVVQASPFVSNIVEPNTVVAAPAMPAPPVFVAPSPVIATPGVPFTDGKGMIEYVMSSYKAMGPQKGAMIQNILTGLGYQNINDVTPEYYSALFAGIEQLKAV